MKTFPAQWTSSVLSLFRFMAGLLFLEHGTGKFFGIPPGAHAPSDPLSYFAAGLELVGGTLLVLGLFTRFTAFILSGQMAFAYFMVHWPIFKSHVFPPPEKSFFPMANGGELAVLYCFAFFYLAFAGGGSWSLDRFVRRA